ncbi:MAG: fimbrillin family protein [Bacteroidaceae bacterium]|nr:fimbrillin family protein [Bacteroidaceae bacterium]
MKRMSHYILPMMTGVLLLVAGCSKSEVLTTYTEVKAEAPTSIEFGVYTGENAATRTDKNYAIPPNNSSWSTDGNTANTRIPDKATGNGSTKGKNNWINGSNNYIIGVYGYWLDGSEGIDSWATATNSTNLNGLTPNFMSNQPVIHESESVWSYSPKKYWPNEKANDKVSFFAYYPFQDYDGMEYDNDDLAEHITPPDKTSTGKNAYTIQFTQNADVDKQIDLMVSSLDTYSKQNLSEKITFNLRHALSLVQFHFYFVKDDNSRNKPDGNQQYNTNDMGGLTAENAQKIEMKINYVTLKNVVNSGTVTPTVNGNPAWTVNLNSGPYADYTVQIGQTLTWNSSAPTSYPKYTTGSEVSKQILMIPQKMREAQNGHRKSILVNYDLKVTYDDAVISYQGCEDARDLVNENYNSYKNFNPDEFAANTRYIIRINMGLRGIDFDVVTAGWNDDDGSPHYIGGDIDYDSNDGN